MTTLLLRLAAPLQSWGDSSRFERRETRSTPTKSGVLGLLAAAQGRRRSDPVEDLARLRFGVRVDQAGELERDFHTARSRDGSTTYPLSSRYYLADALFVAGVEGDDAMLEGLADALRSPVWAPFLGRRSCPPAGPLLLGLRPGALEEALRAEPWHASATARRTHRGEVALRLVRDALPEEGGVRLRDVPVSYDPVHRRHAWREVVEVEPVVVRPGPAARLDDHDPMSLLEP